MRAHGLRGLGASVLLLILALPAGAAEKVDERMREQLRSTITQMRALTQENAALKAELAQAQAQVKATPPEDPEKEVRLKRQASQLRGEKDQLEQQLSGLRAELEQANARSEAEQRDKQKLQLLVLSDHRRADSAEQTANACRADNQALIGMVQEVVQRYESRGVFDALMAREPLTGLRQAQLQRISQRYRDEAAALNATAPPPAAAPGNVPAQPEKH
jgi:chromosome segregation ATPase